MDRSGPLSEKHTKRSEKLGGGKRGPRVVAPMFPNRKGHYKGKKRECGVLSWEGQRHIHETNDRNKGELPIVHRWRPSERQGTAKVRQPAGPL